MIGGWPRFWQDGGAKTAGNMGDRVEENSREVFVSVALLLCLRKLVLCCQSNLVLRRFFFFFFFKPLLKDSWLWFLNTRVWFSFILPLDGSLVPFFKQSDKSKFRRGKKAKSLERMPVHSFLSGAWFWHSILLDFFH